MLGPINNDFSSIEDFSNALGYLHKRKNEESEITKIKKRDEFPSHELYLKYLDDLNQKLLDHLSENNTFFYRFFTRDKRILLENLIKDVDDKKKYYRGLIDFEKKQKLEDNKNTRTMKEITSMGLNPLAIYKILGLNGVANNDLYGGGNTLAVSDNNNNDGIMKSLTPLLIFIMGMLKLLV